MNLVLDIETNGLDPTCIHLVVCKNIDTGEVNSFRSGTNLQNYLDKADKLIMHNGISFDMPILERLWNIKYPYNRIVDTLLISQLHNPIRNFGRLGGNSLANWGEILEFPKLKTPDSFEFYSPYLHRYCEQDVNVTERLYRLMQKEMKGWSRHCIQLEHTVRKLINIQQETGFFLDRKKTSLLLCQLSQDASVLEKELVENFEPTVERMKTKTKIIPFNPQSRQQIGDRLIKRGWKPTDFTDKTGKPVVTEETLSSCTLPEAKQLRTYMLLRKRITQIESWVEAINPKTDRVHGRVMTIGAITTRMSHNSPNMAQIPATYSPYGKECRECWTVEDVDNYRLVGVDASGLELRCLAHYIDDPNYTKEILEGDVHTANMKAAGITDRDQAKTFIYAFLYGAGPTKIGSIVGKSPTTGGKLIKKFLTSMPRLASFREKVIDEGVKTGMVQGLDGRFLRIKSQHSTLNALLQGAGAIICKEWLCHIMHGVYEKGLDARPVANIHDEVQFEVHKKDAEELGIIAKQAMKNTEEILNVKCPLDSNFKIGLNWAETH